MEVKEKANFINVIRGIAIFSMLWGHVIQYSYSNTDINFFQDPVFKFIYTFHMPLFMLISGYCLNFSFNKRSLNDLIIHKIVSIGQPLLVFSMIDIVFSCNYKEFFCGNWFNNCLSIWFLWSVLVCSIPLAIIFKKFNTVPKQLIAIFVSFFALTLIPQCSYNMFMYPYFVLGFCFGYYKNFFNKLLSRIKQFKYFVIPFFAVLYYFFGYRHYIYITGILNFFFDNKTYYLPEIIEGITVTESLLTDFYRFITGLFGSISVILVSKLIYDYSKKIKFHFLSNLGIYSLQIYLLQRIVIEKIYVNLLSNIFAEKNIFVTNQYLYNFVITPVIAICFSILVLGLSYVLTKYAGGILFARKHLKESSISQTVQS